MKVLVINSGSSSIKFRLVDVVEESNGALTTGPALLQGSIKGIGSHTSFEVLGEHEDRSGAIEIRDHAQALRVLFDRLAGSLGGIDAVGHRVVHGADRFVESTLITEEVEAGIDALSELAPLHNPACLAGIRGTREVLGSKLPMVAVFDTAFHKTMPAIAKQYAIPRELADRHRISRYGFHGIAHASLAHGYAATTGTPLERARLITLQLGNGCSVAAIAQGRSVETSMGFTPLEGLVMGTRSGDVDASIISYLCEREKAEPAEVERWLNERSGLLGLSGRSSDMRELLRAAEQEQDQRVMFAIDLFCYRVRKYLGAYLAVLGGADAIVFGGGIGENAPEIRDRICRNMGWCGLRLDPDRNRASVGLAPGQAARISVEESRPSAYVVAADEETWIARETVRCVRGGRS
ncbi:Acetate kinase [Nitrospira tepida]|uniref:Acetate kinase n=1 Tax=Nitrospira tepida TaxID=2973512 RepID=A0AA86MZX4_9BACT|nr:acetate kinase [Nitrospira tepida]CAI4032114.1 Acetate kinase [Nitrospira tepida]